MKDITEKEKQYKRLLSTYDTNLDLFKKILKTYEKEVKKLVKKHPGFVVMQSRVKERASLEKKLQSLDTLPESIRGIQDLLGIRVLFYLNQDIQDFRGTLRECDQFETSIATEPIKDNGFYDACLLLDFPNYPAQVEVQLTTALRHTWSHVLHSYILSDSQQRPPEITHNIQKLYSSMHTELKELTHENQLQLDFIAQQYNQLTEGRNCFKESYLKDIHTEQEAHNLFTKLTLIKRLLIKSGAKLPKGVNLLPSLLDTINRAPTLKYTPSLTPCGKIPAKTYIELQMLCLDIANIQHIKYLYPKEFFTLVETVLLNPKWSDKLKQKAIEAGSSFTLYNFDRLEQVGYDPQTFAIDRFSGYSKQESITLLPFITKALTHLLEPEYYSNQTTDYKRINRRTFSLCYSPNLDALRGQGLALLFKLFSEITQHDKRLQVLTAIQMATTLPKNSRHSDEISHLVCRNTNTVIQFFSDYYQQSDYDIMREMHALLLEFKDRFQGKLDCSAKEILDFFDNHWLYQIHSVLVDGNIRFPKTKHEYSYEEYKAKIHSYIHEINEETLESWISAFEKMLKNINYKSHTDYRWLSRFFSELAQRKPDIGFILLDHHEPLVSPFLDSIFCGLMFSGKTTPLIERLHKFLDKKQHIEHITEFMSESAYFDFKVAWRTFYITKENRDIRSMYRLISGILNHYGAEQEYLDLFKGILTELTIQNDSKWPNFCVELKCPLLKNLDGDGTRLLLHNLVLSKEVTFQMERLLHQIAQVNPRDVLLFFRQRMLHQHSLATQDADDYEAVPLLFEPLIFGTNALQDELAKNADIIIPELLSWMDNASIATGSQQLLRIIYPQLHPILEEAIQQLIDDKNLDKVIAILEGYGGLTTVHAICKELVLKFQLKKEEREKLCCILSGPVVKEAVEDDNFVDFNFTKRNALSPWSYERNKKIQLFAIQFEAHLEKRIASENKSIFQRRELERRNWVC